MREPVERDGRSLVPLLEGSDVPWRDRLLIENLADSDKVPAYYGVLTDRYKYVRYTTGEEELYDLQADPAELSSRHTDPALASTQAGLASALGRLRTCDGSACRVADRS